ncbi:MAG: adenylate/guanylate cyclase domain-containing protein, partial [Myxococcota bacterium]
MLSRLIDRSVVRGEQTIARIRLVLVLLAAIQEVAAAVTNPWARAFPRLALPLAILGAGAAATLWSLGRVRRGLHTERTAWLSVTLDTLLVLGPGLAGALWPRPDYPGQLHLAVLPFLLLVIVGAGLRLSRSVLRGAVVINVAAAVVLLAIDAYTGAAVVENTVEDWLLWGAAFVGAAFLGDAVAQRTRHLVWEGANRVLEAERARQVLGVYVSPAFAAEALASDALLQPGGRRQPVAVLFSDLRGFTRYAEHLPPERLVAELNDYLGAMMTVLEAEGGVVDKFMGDAIMVVFGVSGGSPDDAARAIRAAVGMHVALGAHNRERAARGLPALAQGIGVHFGEAIVGNVGAAGRMQYTCVGDAVNLASRLEAATKELGVPLLVSGTARWAALRAGADLPPLRDLGVVPIRGREEAVHVFGLADHP